ncbi:MAG: CCA tRNA nucleotidyltransferase [Muribaculaceae bacterium]|nr:CCA tRNA nucleotidyltransferase [Muribaculaceae bacterium]
MDKENHNFSSLLNDKIFASVGDVAAGMDRSAYVVGGYVRDLIIGRPSKDIDFVTVGSGIELAKAVHKKLRGSHLSVFKTYGTAQVKRGDLELEFVGARKESYRSDSRNPVVEDGTLEDDISRRDFTINAMALSVTPDSFGSLTDLFDGLGDIRRRIIRTPLDPDITFSDDPLRMMRAIRFATQLDFEIYPETFEAIRRNAERIGIITTERITTELNKIMASPKPSIGWKLLLDSGLLKLIFPELAALKGVDTVNGRGHKDNFYHTLGVLDNVAAVSDKLMLRWAALLHDIAKPRTKRYEEGVGWTFYNHNMVGAKMVPEIFSRLKMPMGQEMKYVRKLVELHMRPIALGDEEVTDSAVRRLMNYAGEDDLADLMILARADLTSRNEAKRHRILANFDIVDSKYEYIRRIDSERARKNPVDGNEIMHIFNLSTGPLVGFFTKNLRQAIKDCEIEDTREAALEYIYRLASEAGVKPVNPPSNE